MAERDTPIEKEANILKYMRLQIDIRTNTRYTSHKYRQS